VSPTPSSSDGNGFLDGLPSSTNDGLDLDAILGSLPTTTSTLNAIVDFAASSDDGESVTIATRVPPSWVEQIDRIREMPGTNLPDIWPKRSNFLRWCVMMGMRHILTISNEINTDGRLESPIDPTLRAQISVEQIGGEIDTRAATINTITVRVKTMAKAINDLRHIGQQAEAANWVNRWMEIANQQDAEFWHDVFVMTLVREESVREALVELIMGSFIVDEQLIDICIAEKLIEHRPGDSDHMGAYL
jgi:hypothetical protein